jgi:hypothetical protein
LSAFASFGAFLSALCGYKGFDPSHCQAKS